MILNLANVSRSDVKYEVINYSDTHKHINITSRLEGEVTILTRLSSMNDVFTLLQVTENIRHLRNGCSIDLVITYLICGRYDRPMHDGDSFDLRIITELLQTRGYRKITLYTPHSDISTALLRANAEYPLDPILKQLLAKYLDPETLAYKGVCLIAPDMGSVKRIHNFVRYLGNPIPVVIADKERDLRTGKVKSVVVLNPQAIEGVAYVYDDLCDRGGTFIGLAKQVELLKPGCEVNLAVTHGIFPDGPQLLFDGGISSILTTNSYIGDQEYQDNFTVVQVI